MTIRVVTLSSVPLCSLSSLLDNSVATWASFVANVCGNPVLSITNATCNHSVSSSSLQASSNILLPVPARFCKSAVGMERQQIIAANRTFA